MVKITCTMCVVPVCKNVPFRRKTTSSSLNNIQWCVCVCVCELFFVLFIKVKRKFHRDHEFSHI